LLVLATAGLENRSAGAKAKLLRRPCAKRINPTRTVVRKDLYFSVLSDVYQMAILATKPSGIDIGRFHVLLQ